jgi:hypothetical protein
MSNTTLKRKPRPKPTPVEQEVVGKCPECGRDVLASDSKYYCQNIHYKSKSFEDLKKYSCDFKFLRSRFQNAGKDDITPTEMRSLLAGDAIPLPGMKSKDGETFDTFGMLKFKPPYGWSINFVTLNAIAMTAEQTKRPISIKASQPKGEKNNGII